MQAGQGCEVEGVTHHPTLQHTKRPSNHLAAGRGNQEKSGTTLLRDACFLIPHSRARNLSSWSIEEMASFLTSLSACKSCTPFSPAAQGYGGGILAEPVNN